MENNKCLKPLTSLVVFMNSKHHTGRFAQIHRNNRIIGYKNGPKTLQNRGMARNNLSDHPHIRAVENSTDRPEVGGAVGVGICFLWEGTTALKCQVPSGYVKIALENGHL